MAVDFDRVRLMAARGSTEDALAALDGLLLAEPDHLPAMLLKGSLLLGAREGEKALELYRRAAAAAPRSAEALNGLARCLHALGRDDEALEAAEAARLSLNEGDNFRQAAP